MQWLSIVDAPFRAQNDETVISRIALIWDKASP
jgi:hypothetical protein